MKNENNKASEKKQFSVTEIEALLREAGVQPTAQRLTICQYLLGQADHPTAAEIKRWADSRLPKISLATVYNTLNTLVEAGLVAAIKLPEVNKVIYDNNLHPHFHFIDLDTGKVYDIPSEQVKLHFELPARYEVKETRVLIYGHLKPAN